MEPPETRYVAVGDADVAYQVLGDGPVDLLYCLGLGSHVEGFWEHPVDAQFLIRLASFSRLILFDRRGTGASDGVPLSAMPTWEEWSEDIAAVMNGAGSKQAAILAMLDAGGLAMLFAAMHPERVSALVLVNAGARYIEADDYPIGVSPDVVDSLVAMTASAWGTSELARLANPSMSDDVEYVRHAARMERSSATPRAAAAQYANILRADVRQALPLIQAPTMVFNVKENPITPIELGRYVADHINGATFVEVPGGDMTLTPANYWVIDEIAAFLTGERLVVEADRILTTVLFTDIVGSTQQVASLGDQAWKRVLDAHDRLVRDELRHYRGREVNTTGDGFVANFDGPARAIRCAQSIIGKAQSLGIELRTGLHTGECEVRGEDLGGLAVHIAARVGTVAQPGEVLVSSTVKDLVAGSGIAFEDRGDHGLKGVPGSWRLYAVAG
jgi:class 3 adenylate cyclase/pimeloyl-ACP methyl ester carboxylesterase